MDLNNLEFYDDPLLDNVEDEMEYTYFSLCNEVLIYCIIPVIKQVIAGNLPNILLIILWLICLSLLSQIKCQYSHNFMHILSSVFGFITAYHSVGQSTSILLMTIVGVYSVIYLYDSFPFISRYVSRGPTVLAFCLLTQLSCEFGMNPVVWNKIRGIAMIQAMKLVSLGFDLDSLAIIVTPTIWEYLGYSLNMATIVFGPWLSFNDYLLTVTKSDIKFSFNELLRTIFIYTKSILFLLYSTCIASYLIADDSYKWLVAYRDAQAFRYSHYFVCTFSQANINLFNLLSGETDEFSQFPKQRKDFTVARALRIEAPRSLVEVVVNWNLPMHQWLKHYIFFPTRKFGTFIAVMSTYIASSLLHGVNFQLSAVLLSLGVYTYIEHVLRRRLSTIYNACLGARSCRSCSHTNKTGPLVWTVNIGFGFLSVFHLAYLGLMFDNSSQQSQGYSMGHTLSKWANLDYLSHIVAAFTFIFYFLIRN